MLSPSLCPCSGEPVSDEVREQGCARLFIASVTLVCVPEELLGRLDRQPHSWTEAAGQALLAARCAFQRTLFLDVAGVRRAAAGDVR